MKNFLFVLFILVNFINVALAQTPCREVVGYYPGWQWYDRTQAVNPNTIKYEKYTILNYAFFSPKPDGWIVQTADSIWGDPILLEGQMNWSTNTRDITTSIPYKAHQAGIKIMPSIGGWTLSDNFSAIAASPTKRTLFAHSCNVLIRKYKFDGIDLDWEYPGYADHGGTPADKQNFTLLLRQVRDSLTSIEVQQNKTLMLTIAVGASPSNMNNVEWANITPIVDIINLMSYDFYGAFDSRCNHNSPLYATGGTGASVGFSIDEAVTTLLQTYNVPANKINAGIAFYGRTQICSTTPTLHGVSTGAVDNANFGVDEGSPQYYNIIPKIGNGFTRYWDNVAKVPYLISTANNSFVSYDDQESIAAKAQYINSKNLRGAIIWEITGDYVQNANGTMSTPLVDTLIRTFCMGTTVNVPPAVVITTPTANQNFAVAPSNVSLAANANDPDGTIVKVEFYNGATLLGTSNSAPYSFSYPNLAQGSYTVRAKATDNIGAATWSSAVTFTVGTVVNQAPLVSLNTDAASYTAAANINMTATASDPDGTVSKIEFYEGNNLLTTKTAAPFNYIWSGVAVGSYTLKAKVFDNQNAWSWSNNVTVTVAAPSSNPLCNSSNFVIGSPYATNDYVVNTVNGVRTVFQCTVGGWCSQTGQSTAYIPGTGWAWQQAWNQIATCVVTSTVGLNAMDIQVSPNPFTAEIRLNKGVANIDKVTIINTLGQVLGVASFASQDLVLDTQNWVQGTYFLRLEGASGVATVKVVKL